MKKLLIIILTLFSVQAFAQYPAIQAIGSDSTVVKSKGALQGRIINWAYPDTTAANRERISHYPGSQIFVNNLIYIRDSTATKWLVSEKGTSNISILNDSTLIISNLSGSDTFHTTVLISNWTVLSDTTIQVCGTGGCDTVYTSPTVFAKPYVDSVIIHNGVSLDTLYYYVNGNAIVGGYIGSQFYNKTQIDSIFTVTLQNYYTQTQIDSINTVNGVTNESNHIISGGVVTYSGTGLTYYVSVCIYMIGGTVYYSPQATITLAAADATNPRIDLFAVDTLSEAIKITGTAASVPLTPQINPASQLALTTGITLPPNATTPTGVSSTLIYDENVEWTTGGTATVNYNNTTNPYHGTKDAFISAYAKNSTLTFTGTTQTVNGQTLRTFIRLNNANYSFQFQFFNGTTAVSNLLTLNGFGFSPTLYNSYQNVSIPLSAFIWSGTSFDKLVITMTGKGNQTAGTYYLDYISLEGGTPVIPPATDYSNKVDSVKNRNDSLFWYANGIPNYSGFNAYQRSQTDSITAQLRSEIVSAAGGGVISFNGRNGSVTSDSTDYNSFFYTKHITDSLLASKISAANLSLGAVTSTSQAINNSAGTGVVLPSASISTAGLMTAGDKVLVNTISGKVNYTDTAAMLNPYLRKVDAFTKSQADALYKPITYVPSWSEITGKPTIPAAQIQSDYTQTDTTKLDYIKHKPTIPTNNNQLTNGMGYITSIDTANTLHTYDSTLYTTIYKNSLKLNIADTSSMLAHYLNSVGFGLSKTGQVVSVDTSVIHSSAYNNATYQGKITLTTTGTSGAATLSGNTLNIPQYSGGSGGTTTNSVTFNNSGTGDASGTTFNGSVARTVSSNTIGAVAKADSTTAYVTPTQLAAINNHINLYKPLYGVASDTSIHVYTETDSTLNDNSDTTLPTTKAVKAYVDNHAGGGGVIDSTNQTGILKGDGSHITAAVSGTDIKTINGNSILGGGDLTISGGGGTTTTVTEQKNYYHNELYLYQAINTSTGAFSIDSTKGVSDLLPITGGESITVVDSTSSVTMYGWTYDSTFTGISEIRSNSLIGTTLNTYTFTAPSNARYLCIYVRYGGVDYSKQISIKSTNSFSYTVPIMPENYTGTDRQKIQQALNFQRFFTSPVICYGTYFIDSALMVSSGTKLINYGKIQLARGAKDNIIRNEAVYNRRFPRGNRNILITGTGVFNGTEDGWGTDNPTGVGTQRWRSIGILLANVQNFTVSGVTLRNTNSWAMCMEQSRIGIVTGLTVSQNGQVINMDGIDVRRGSNRININNIKGYAADDIVALTNVKVGPTINILDSTIYEPYKTDLDIYEVNVDNIQRDSVGVLSDPYQKSGILLLTQDSLKIHDVSIKNITGYQQIIVGYSAYYRTTQQGINDMYNIQVNNTGKAWISVQYPIKNSSFLNIARTGVNGQASCVFLPGTVNTERRYYGSYPEYFEANGQNGLIHLDTLANLSLTPTRLILGGTDDGFHRLQVLNGARMDTLFGSTLNNKLTLMSSVTPSGGTIFMQPNGGKFLFGSSTNTGNNFSVTSAADGDGIAINGSSSISPALQLQVGGSLYGLLGAAPATGKLLANSAAGDVILRSISGQILFGVGYTNASMAIKNGLVGINTYSPTTALTTTAFATSYAAKSTSYTLTGSDHTIEVTTSLATTQTLPTAVGITGREYLITNSGTGTVTIATTSSQTFVNVSGTPTTLTVAQFTSYKLISNGANWLAFKMVN